MTSFTRSALNRVRRLQERGHYDKATIYPIIDEALICHVALVQDGQPFVIPTIHARMGDELILHGANASRLLQHIERGEPVCVGITLLDGLVLARSVFHSSMNYRSVVLFGRGRVVSEPAAKLAALEALSEHLAQGRWQDARKPTARELKATKVVAIAIDSASAKVRSGPPGDDEADYDLPIWAGVVPLDLRAEPPEPDPRLPDGTAVPAYAAHYVRR
ncbi:MAG: pyridoxamine 5'-phosphate oxidase family protein [Caldilineaceae bacterium]|nr:pyridoxamine 5'-phosphate oxidase family protein [Caldilineaceae bacterium]